MLFYKCLRLTHEGGHVSFYPGLDDHSGYDRFGDRVSFSATGELHQLNAIKDTIEAMSRFHLMANSVVVVCDFDLLKFSGYSVAGILFCGVVTGWAKNVQPGRDAYHFQWIHRSISHPDALGVAGAIEQRLFPGARAEDSVADGANQDRPE